MGEFLSYSIVSGFLLLAMYLAYRLFLAGDNQHAFNRGVLLSIYIVSFAVSPFIISPVKLHVSAGTHAIAPEGIQVVATEVSDFGQPLWCTILIWLFISGMAVIAVRTVMTWIRLTKVISKGERIRNNDYTLVVTDDDRFAPFSWMNFVVISRSDYENNYSAIMSHELKHVVCHHWIDLLIAQIVCVINWFNPAAWLMRDELMLVHEYQADMAVLENGHDSQEYQRLLIKKAVGARFPSLANSLNHSKLKKRITMMYKEKSGAGCKLKTLALVPMLALALAVASAPAVRAAVATIGSSDTSITKKTEAAATQETQTPTYKVTEILNNGKETSVTVKAENFGSRIFVTECSLTNGSESYPANSMGLDMADGVATIHFAFPVTDELKEPRLKLSANGREVFIDLDKKSGKVTLGDLTNDDVTILGVSTIKKDSVKLTTTGSGAGNVTVYLDGKQISEDDMKKINPDNIESISVVRQGNAIIITSKK